MDNQYTEIEQRQRVVAIAHEWLGTPYRHAARVKGHGADCLTLLAEIFAEAGLVEKVAIPYYPADWHLHRAEERYMSGLLKYAKEIPGNPQPGDIALWKFGRCFSHGAIVVKWPVIIHAHIRNLCSLENAEKATWLKYIGENTADIGKERPVRFFSFWS